MVVVNLESRPNKARSSDQHGIASLTLLAMTGTQVKLVMTVTVKPTSDTVYRQKTS